MTDSPSTEPEAQPAEAPNVHQAMANAMANVRAVGKWGTNKEQGYSFRSIDHFMTALNPAMASAGVHIAPRVLQRLTDDSHLTSSNKVMRWVDVEMEFTFYGPAGDSFAVVTWGEARDAADKATNKAMTGAFKYAIMQAFMVPTEDLADADAHSPEVEGEPQQQRRQQQAPQVDPAVHARRLLANADPATVDALRLEALGVCDEAPPGEARDLGLRALYSKVDQAEALGSVVELPEAWRRGDVALVPLWELINGARTITIPSGETTQPAQDAPGEPQGGPVADPGQQETAQEPDAAQGAVQRARAQADRQHAERSSEPMEEDPWATPKA